MSTNQDLIWIDGKLQTVADIESEIKSLRAENAFLKSVVKSITSVSIDVLDIAKGKE